MVIGFIHKITIIHILGGPIIKLYIQANPIIYILVEEDSDNFPMDKVNFDYKQAGLNHMATTHIYYSNYFNCLYNQAILIDFSNLS